MLVANDFLKKVQKGKNKPENEYLLDKSHAATIGMVIGAMGGLYIGYTRRYNLLLCVFIGGVGGNLLTKALIKSKKHEDGGE